MIHLSISKPMNFLILYTMPILFITGLVFSLIKFENTEDWILSTMFALGTSGLLSFLFFVLFFNKMSCDKTIITFTNPLRKRTFDISQYSFFICDDGSVQLFPSSKKKGVTIFFPLSSHNKIKKMESLAKETSHQCFYSRKFKVFVFSKKGMDPFFEWMEKNRQHDFRSYEYDRIN